MNEYLFLSVLIVLAAFSAVLIYLFRAKPQKAIAAPPLVFKAPDELPPLSSEYATGTERESTFKALARLSHNGVRSDGSLIDWRTGASITSCPADDEFPAHLTIRYPGAKRICIVSRRGLNQFHALQIAISARLTGEI
jgi:hypothetical protein